MTITPPPRPTDHPDRFLDAQEAIEADLLQLVDDAVAVGWGEIESLAAVVAVAKTGCSHYAKTSGSIARSKSCASEAQNEVGTGADSADRPHDRRHTRLRRRQDLERAPMKRIKPVVTPVPTLGTFKLPVIELDCRECDRHGKYNRDRAIERHGAEMTMNRFMRLMANCPRDGNEKRPCRVGCPDIAYMFDGAPFQN